MSLNNFNVSFQYENRTCIKKNTKCVVQFKSTNQIGRFQSALVCFHELKVHKNRIFPFKTFAN